MDQKVGVASDNLFISPHTTSSINIRTSMSISNVIHERVCRCGLTGCVTLALFLMLTSFLKNFWWEEVGGIPRWHCKFFTTYYSTSALVRFLKVSRCVFCMSFMTGFYWQFTKSLFLFYIIAVVLPQYIRTKSNCSLHAVKSVIFASNDTQNG